MSGSWHSGDGLSISLTLNGARYRGIMQVAYDEAQDSWVPVISAMDGRGQALWGIRNLDVPAGEECKALSPAAGGDARIWGAVSPVGPVSRSRRRARAIGTAWGRRRGYERA